VAVAAEKKKSDVAYPLKGDLKAKIRVNSAYAPKFKKENIVQYAKYPLDALTKASIYRDDSQIVEATYKADFSLRGSIEVCLWQK
jgi:Holliday junction resolvase RusA-like endonuclease